MSGYQNRLLDPNLDGDLGSTGIAPGKRTLTQSLPAGGGSLRGQEREVGGESLRGQEREVADFDAGAGDDFYDTRATIDSPAATSSRLSDAQLRKAKRRNRHWQEKLGFATSVFGGGDVATGEFADNVADKQASLGLPVDGIAGPQTLHAVAGAASAAARPDSLEATRGRRDANGAARRATAAGIDAVGDGDFYDSRATIDTAEPGANPASAAASAPGGASAATNDAFAGDDPFGMHLIGQR